MQNRLVKSYPFFRRRRDTLANMLQSGTGALHKWAGTLHKEAGVLHKWAGTLRNEADEFRKLAGTLRNMTGT